MSVRFLPATVIGELRRQNTQLDVQRGNLQSVTTTIDAYRSDALLAGRAFGAHKDYFGDGHLPFITAYRSMMLSQRNANVSHISHLGALTHDYYNREQIDREARQLAWSIRAAQAMVVLLWPAHGSWQTILDTRRTRRDVLCEKQRELATYEANTSSLYNDVESRLPNVRRLLSRIEMQTKCPATGVVSLPTMGQVALAELLDENGEILWDTVSEMLGRGLDGLSEYELDALAELYMSMDDPYDLAQFINAMGVKIGPGFYMGGVTRPDWMSESELAAFIERNTIWYFDSALVGALRDRVELRIADLLTQEWGGDVAAGQERLRLLQHSGLMYVISNLTPVHFEDTNRDQIFMIENHGEIRSNPQVRDVLFGTAESPGITITQGENGSWVVCFVQLKKQLNMNDGSWNMNTLPMPNNSADRKHLTNFQEREINISAAYGPGSNNPNFSQTNRDRAGDSALRNHEHNWGESFFNAVVSTGVGFIPFVGDAVGTATGIAGPIVDYAQINRVRNDINKVRDAGELSEEILKNGLNGVFISENGSYTPPQLWFSPHRLVEAPWDTLPVGTP